VNSTIRQRLQLEQHLRRGDLKRTLRFASNEAEPEAKASQSEPPLAAAPPSVPKPQPKTKTKTTWWDRFLMIAPLSNVLGGVSLLTGALLPETKPVSNIKNNKTATIQIAKSNETDYKQFFSQMGWTLSTVGMFTGCINGVSIGRSSKQPSMVLSSVACLIASPLLMVDPTMCARTAMWFFTAPWLIGYANTIRNKQNLPPGETPRELDMSAIFDKTALQSQASATSCSMTKTWFKEIGKTLHFVAKDHLVLVSDSAKQLKTLVTQPKQLAQGVRQGLSETLQMLRGQRKELPAFVNPSVSQNQVGAMLMYIGSTPILMMGGPVNQVTEVCTKLLALGALTANTSLFASGIKEKNASLLVGVPLSFVGSATMDQDWGMGLSQASTGLIQEYFRQGLKKSEKQTELEQKEPTTQAQ
jgi:hypothetical protein